MNGQDFEPDRTQLYSTRRPLDLSRNAFVKTASTWVELDRATGRARAFGAERESERRPNRRPLRTTFERLGRAKPDARFRRASNRHQPVRAGACTSSDPGAWAESITRSHPGHSSRAARSPESEPRSTHRSPLASHRGISRSAPERLPRRQCDVAPDSEAAGQDTRAAQGRGEPCSASTPGRAARRSARPTPGGYAKPATAGVSWRGQCGDAHTHPGWRRVAERT